MLDNFNTAFSWARPIPNWEHNIIVGTPLESLDDRLFNWQLIERFPRLYRGTLQIAEEMSTSELSTPTRKLCPSFDAARKMSILGLEVEHAWTEAQVQDCLNN
jgi:hypothetical protein